MSHQYLWKSFQKRQVLSIKLISLGRVYLHLYICECWRKEIQERHWTKFLEILPENKERTFPQHYLFLKIDSHTLGFAYIHNDTFCQILISRFFQFCFFIFWLSSVTIFYVLRSFQKEVEKNFEIEKYLFREGKKCFRITVKVGTYLSTPTRSWRQQTIYFFLFYFWFFSVFRRKKFTGQYVLLLNTEFSYTFLLYITESLFYHLY